jgi:hypothetical protein
MFKDHYSRGRKLALEIEDILGVSAPSVNVVQLKLEAWQSQAEVLVEAVFGRLSPAFARWQKRCQEGTRRTAFRNGWDPFVGMEQVAAALAARGVSGANGFAHAAA